MPAQPQHPEWLPEWRETAFPDRSFMRAGPILVATEGSPDSDAMLHVALALAGRTNADVRLLSVTGSPAPVEVQAPSFAARQGHAAGEARRVRERDVRRQLARTVGADRPWPVQVESGQADEIIDLVARAHDARLILCGRGRHSLVERVTSGETLTRLITHAATPIYGVERGNQGLARRIVVAMDFSRYAVAALQTALQLASPQAIVTLVHGWSRFNLVASAERTYEEAIPAMFEAVTRHVAETAGVQVETATLEGTSPGDVVSDYALAAGADLVVCASHGHGLLTRLTIGSVAAVLLRRAPCSFFCMPARALASASGAHHASGAASSAVPSR